MKKNGVISGMVAFAMAFSLIVSPVADAKESEYATSITNLFEGGDFENGIPSGFDMATGSVNLTVEESNGNKVGCITLTDKGDTVGRLHTEAAAGDRIGAYSIKVAALNHNGLSAKNVYEWTDPLKEISSSKYPTFTEVSGIARIGQWPSIFGQENSFLYQFGIPNANSEIGAKIYIDDIAFYDITDAKEIIVDGDANLNDASYININGKKLANPGDMIALETSVPRAVVTVNGRNVENVNGKYIFTMPDVNAEIKVSGGATSIVNLFEGGDFENGIPSGFDMATGSVNLTVEESNGNKVGCITLTDKGDTVGRLHTEAAAGDRIGAYSIKVAALNHNGLSAKNVYEWTDPLKEISSSKYPTFTEVSGIARIGQWPSIFGQENSFLYQFGIPNANSEIGAKIYIDDIAFYDITDAKEIISDSDVKLNDASYININGKKLANPGDTIIFETVVSDAVVKINGEVIEGNNGEYAFTMPGSDAEITVIDNTSAPDFFDDFTGYTIEKGDCVGVQNRWKLADGIKVLARNESGARWITSGVFNGAAGDYQNGYAYIDAENKMLKIQGAYSYGWSGVNLDIPAIDKINRIRFTTGTGNRAVGVGLFCSKSEQNALIFGSKTSSEFVPSMNGAAEGKPFVAMMAYDSAFGLGKMFATEDTIRNEWGTDAVNINWDVQVVYDQAGEATAIEWAAKGPNGELSEGTITDKDALSLVKSSKYPIAAYSVGDAYSFIKNVNIWYTKDQSYVAPYFSDDFLTYNKADGSSFVADSFDEAYMMSKGKKVIAQNTSGAKWVTSDVFDGETNNVDGVVSHVGRACINNGKLSLAGYSKDWFMTAAVNLETPKKTGKVTKYKFTVDRAPRRVEARLFVGNHEMNYITFGQTGVESSVYGHSGSGWEPGEGEIIYSRFTPYVAVSAGDFDGNSVESVRGTKKDNIKMLYRGEGTKGLFVDYNDEVIPGAETWSVSDTKIYWTVEIDYDENGKATAINWEAKGNADGRSSGVITDVDALKIVDANWEYPFAFAAGGDGAFGVLSDVEFWASDAEETQYETKDYSEADFEKLYKEADYGGTKELYKLLSLDLSDVINNHAGADIIVNSEAVSNYGALIGAQVEFSDDYELYYDDNGNLKPDYIAYASERAPISAFRIGGGSSLTANFWNTINHEPSVYVSIPDDINLEKLDTSELPQQRIEELSKYVIGGQAQDTMNMGLAELLKALNENNPSAEYTLCVSMLTTTPQDTQKIIHFMTDTTGSYADKRYEMTGVYAPFRLRAIELTNECDAETAARKSWYLQEAKKHISAIREISNSIKIIACGPTAPWDYSYEESWVDALINGVSYNGTSESGIAGLIDAMSYHPYYYGYKVDGLFDYAAKYRRMFVDSGYDVKISITEYAVWCKQENNYYDIQKTTSLRGALTDSTFISRASQLDFIEACYSHDLAQEGAMWSRWQYENGKFVKNPRTIAYDVLGANSGKTILKTKVTVSNNVDDKYGSAHDRFSAFATKVDDSTIALVLTNAMAYTDVDVNVSLPAEYSGYSLVSKTVFTAPNMYTFTADSSMENLSVVSKTVYENADTLTACNIPNKSIVVLMLSGASAQSELSEKFDYADKSINYASIIGEETDYTEAILASNANGVKWLSDTSKGGYNSGRDTFGTIEIIGGKLKITNDYAGSDETAVNLSTAEYGIVDNVSKFTFKTNFNGASGGVRLFVDENGVAAVDLNNTLSGINNGVVDWTIEITDGEIFWTAVGVAASNSGKIAAGNLNNWKYLIQCYTDGANSGSITFDDIIVKYGNAGEKDVVYTVNDGVLNVTVNKSLSESYNVIISHYKKGRLIKSEIGTTSEIPQDIDSTKIFVWGEDMISPLLGTTVLE